MSSSVTVIIPAYNCATYVAEAIDSVLAQDYETRELIVVNDGSTDDTLEVLRSYGNQIRVLDQKNGGPAAARNAGLSAARGDYIAFLDGDDVWIQGKLAAQVRHLDANPDVGTVFTNWHIWHRDADGSFRRPAEIESQQVSDEIDADNSGWLYNRLLFDCWLLTSTVMMRRSMVTSIGDFDLSLWNGEDYDYWIRASRLGKITKLASVGALYRILPQSVSRRPRETDYEYEVISRALGRWGLVGPDGARTDTATMHQRLDKLKLGHGYTHLLHGDPQVAYKAYRALLSNNPAQLRVWVRGAQAAWKAGIASWGTRRADE